MLRRTKPEVERYVASVQAAASSPREVRTARGRGVVRSLHFVWLILMLFRLHNVECIAAKFGDNLQQCWCSCGAQRKDIASPLVVLKAKCCGFGFIFSVMLVTGCIAQSVMEVVTGFSGVLILERRVVRGCKHLF